THQQVLFIYPTILQSGRGRCKSCGLFCFTMGVSSNPFQRGPWLQLVGQQHMLDKPKTCNLKQIKSKTGNDRVKRMQTGHKLIRHKTEHKKEKREKPHDKYGGETYQDLQRLKEPQ
ncbi:MAG: hypothetical protein ACKPKO_55285, partial [Candidatus Fonsibacter sp.]